MKTLTLSLLSTAALLLAGCSTEPKVPLAPVANASPPATGTAPSSSSRPVAPVVAAQPEYLDPRNPLSSQRSVFFGFDDYAVDTQYRNVIELQGKYLASHPKVAVRVEGNTDERGSAEYNLALGQRRAQAVVNALHVYGVKDAQLEAVSWGKEKPRMPGHDESAWAQNRRADVAYPAH